MRLFRRRRKVGDIVVPGGVIQVRMRLTAMEEQRLREEIQRVYVDSRRSHDPH